MSDFDSIDLLLSYILKAEYAYYEINWNGGISSQTILPVPGVTCVKAAEAFNKCKKKHVL